MNNNKNSVLTLNTETDINNNNNRSTTEASPVSELAQTLIERRKSLKMSRQALAARVGISPAYIWVLEGGKHWKTGKTSRASVDVLKKLSDALDLPFHQLLALGGYPMGAYQPESPEGPEGISTEANRVRERLTEIFRDPEIPTEAKSAFIMSIDAQTRVLSVMKRPLDPSGPSSQSNGRSSKASGQAASNSYAAGTPSSSTEQPVAQGLSKLEEAAATCEEAAVTAGEDEDTEESERHLSRAMALWTIAATCYDDLGMSDGAARCREKSLSIEFTYAGLEPDVDLLRLFGLRDNESSTVPLPDKNQHTTYQPASSSSPRSI